MNHILYRTENNLTKHFYYGVHCGSDDSYLGSGIHLNRAIKKYGRSNFIRRTIYSGTKEQCYLMESLMVDNTLIANPLCYNLREGGFGGWDHINKDRVAKPKAAPKPKFIPSFKGMKHTDAVKEQIRTNQNSRRITFKGINFDSVNEAARHFNVNPGSIRYRLNNPIIKRKGKL